MELLDTATIEGAMITVSTAAAGRTAAIERTGTIERGLLAGLYTPPRTPVIVDVPSIVYLVVDGHGAREPAEACPATGPWADAADALAAVSAAVASILGPVAPVGPVALPPSSAMPLEILWSTPDQWALMMAQPRTVNPDVVQRAVELVRGTTRAAPLAALSLVRRRRLHEGWAVQLMTVGSAPDCGERAAFDRLDGFLHRHGYQSHGARHEIRLDDPAVTAPEALRTIYRQPVVALG